MATRRAGSFFMAGAIVVGLLALLPARARAGGAADAARFLADTNRERAAHGVGPLATNDALAGVAQAWAQQMANGSHLAHNPNLVGQIDRTVTTNWTKYGENVGTGPDVESIQAAFVRSPEHHANMIDPAFTEVGIAVSYAANGALWVTLDFLQPMAARQVTTASAGASPAHSAIPAPARPPALVAAAPAVPPVLVAVLPTPPTPLPATAPVVVPPTLDIAALASAIDLPAPFAPHSSGRLRGWIEAGDAILLAGVAGGAVRARRAA